MGDPAILAGHRESVACLRSAGFGQLLDALADPKVCTISGRLLVKRVARSMRVDSRTVARQLRAARTVLIRAGA